MAAPARRRPGLPVPAPALIREMGGRFLQTRRRCDGETDLLLPLLSFNGFLLTEPLHRRIRPPRSSLSAFFIVMSPSPLQPR